MLRTKRELSVGVSQKEQHFALWIHGGISCLITSSSRCFIKLKSRENVAEGFQKVLWTFLSTDL